MKTFVLYVKLIFLHNCNLFWRMRKIDTKSSSVKKCRKINFWFMSIDENITDKTDRIINAFWSCLYISKTIQRHAHQCINVRWQLFKTWVELIFHLYSVLSTPRPWMCPSIFHNIRSKAIESTGNSKQVYLSSSRSKTHGPLTRKRASWQKLNEVEERSF